VRLSYRIALLLMNTLFIILNEVKDPARWPPAAVLLDPSHGSSRRRAFGWQAGWR
jgi:hypothetical protein